MNNHSEKDLNPFRRIGIFLLALGLILMSATLDLFGWGSMQAYFRWEMLLVFIGLIMLLKGKFTGSIVLLSVGTWFMLPDIWPARPDIVRVAFWPATLVLAGITFLIPSPTRWRRPGKN